MVVYSESESSLPRNGGKKQSTSKISAKYLPQAARACVATDLLKIRHMCRMCSNYQDPPYHQFSKSPQK